MAKEILQAELSNGLKILGEVSPSQMSVGMGFFVRTGARDEQPAESGVSHFLEHMMFKGTAKRSSMDITFEMGNIGAQSNAFTSEENTVYYSMVLPEYFEQMFELLSDMLRPALDGKEFDTEKNVILEEIAVYQDRPYFYLMDNAYRDFFSPHPAGNSVLGSKESIGALSRDQMQEYFDKRYSPSNIALVAAGKFSWTELTDLAAKYCGHWKDFKTTRPLAGHVPSKKQKVYKKKNVSQTHILFLTGGCSAQDEERYALTLLGMILGDSSGSKLYWELIDRGLADSASADNDERDGAGVFGVYASTDLGRAKQVTEIVTRIIANPLDFTVQDLERAKNKLCARVALDGELPMGRLMGLGMEWNYRKSLTPLAQIVERVKSVSKAEIENALKRFPLKEWSEYRLVPEDT